METEQNEHCTTQVGALPVWANIQQAMSLASPALISWPCRHKPALLSPIMGKRVQRDSLASENCNFLKLERTVSIHCFHFGFFIHISVPTATAPSTLSNPHAISLSALPTLTMEMRIGKVTSGFGPKHILV
jgi:hypothetical protein